MGYIAGNGTEESTAASSWRRPARTKAGLHEAGDSAPGPALADAELMVEGSGRGDLSVLDLPLEPYAGMTTNTFWGMFVWRLADTEAKCIVGEEEQVWAESASRNGLDVPIGLSKEEARADYSARLAWWKENQELLLRPGSSTVAVIVWLWHNGLHDQAAELFACIWHTVRANHQSRQRIPWTAENALSGFRVAAHRDWDDGDHAEFAALFRQRHVNPETQCGGKHHPRGQGGGESNIQPLAPRQSSSQGG